MTHLMFTKETIPRGLDNIKFEVLQLENQLQLLEDIFEKEKQKQEVKSSCCENFFCFKYYENILHKFGYGNKKKD